MSNKIGEQIKLLNEILSIATFDRHEDGSLYIAEAKGDVHIVKGGVGKVDGDVWDRVKGNVRNVWGKVHTVEGYVSSAEGSVGIVKGDVTIVEGDVWTRVGGNVAIVEGNVHTVEGDVDYLHGKVKNYVKQD